MSLMTRPKARTHTGMPTDKLLRIAGEVEEIAEDGRVDAEALDDLSADLGVPREKLYAGLGMSGDAELRLEHKTQFVVCTGACQDYGALPCVAELLDLREERLEDGAEAFDVVPRHCLKRCEQGPAIEVRTVDGTAIVADATPARVRDTVDELFASV